MAVQYRSYLILLFVLVGLAVVLLVPGIAITQRLWGAEALAGLYWACGLCFTAATLGGLPLLMAGRSPQETGTLALGSMAVRMGITLFGALAITLATDVPRTHFLLWLVVCYFVFLIAEIGFILQRTRPE